ncbi:vomeronasal type-2 receptor 26-like [Mantella aurantiaca]
MINDQNGRDLTEADEIKKRWQHYSKELYKSELNANDDHDEVVTNLEPKILKYLQSEDCVMISLILLITASLVFLPEIFVWNEMQNSKSQCKISALRSMFEYEYYMAGDIIIGGLFSAHLYSVPRTFHFSILRTGIFCLGLDMEEYRSILVFMFAINEINKNAELLPNITLGYHIYDTCKDVKKTLIYVLQILSGRNIVAPNYDCREDGEVAGFIGDSSFQTTQAMAQLLSLYRYTHISYRVMEPSLSDRQMYPTFYRTVPNDRVRYTAVIKFLLHLGWNFVGMITLSDGSGDAEFSELSKALTQHGICIEYVIQFPKKIKDFQNTAMIIDKSLHQYVKRVHYEDHLGKVVSFDENGEWPSPLQLYNWVFYPTGEYHKRKPVALFGNLTEMKEFQYISHPDIIWKNGKVPQARCNEKCPPGYHKSPKEGIHSCCYNCVLCPEGEIANTTDSEMCYKCPDEDWPDKERVMCIPRTYEFLSYENDLLVLFFLLIALFFCITTLFIFASFIYYRDTPVVKANNRTVSFVLLTAIFLSFLCVYLFLGRPVDITCMLRQISFGIFFSIAVSSVLAKTVTVCIAFKATKPNSIWKKWVGGKVSNFIVLFSSSVQVLICVIWLSVSPPYKEYDIHSSPGKIIIQCNEGSGFGFYSMLGYMGFLAAVSFVLAFMVRTLPDSFNEAKYITFSMLVFCSVWIAMIPAYISTRGKYMVAVEIFTILTSSAGILICIFFPKMYILLLKSDLNTRKCVLHTHFS